MDTEPPDPYRKRKIKSDSQKDDYLINDLNKIQYTTSMLTSNIKNLTIDEKNPKDIRNYINKTSLGWLGVKPNTHHGHKKKNYNKQIYPNTYKKRKKYKL
ncbi:hypothetical protein Godav_006393, partial [Gossypium davidsonii]|nr:hypothetical protein [Gossypium davidsonii]